MTAWAMTTQAATTVTTSRISLPVRVSKTESSHHQNKQSPLIIRTNRVLSSSEQTESSHHQNKQSPLIIRTNRVLSSSEQSPLIIRTNRVLSSSEQTESSHHQNRVLSSSEQTVLSSSEQTESSHHQNKQSPLIIRTEFSHQLNRVLLLAAHRNRVFPGLTR